MSEHISRLARLLLEQAGQEIDTVERGVLEKLAQRAPLAHDARRRHEEQRDFGQRLADRIARFGGSWTFIILFGVVLAAWVALNTVILARHAFDPYPFVFLNLVLSMLAALQAPVIMMSQNRQAEKDRIAAAHDYEVNLKAELEILSLHEKLDRLRTEQLAGLIEDQRRQIEMLDSLLAARTKPAG